LEKSISANGLSPALLLWSGLFTRMPLCCAISELILRICCDARPRVRPYPIWVWRRLHRVNSGLLALPFFSIDDRVVARDLHAQRKHPTGPISVSIDRIANFGS
jgi:hypothetical protein